MMDTGEHIIDLSDCVCRAGLTIVPVVPWAEALRRQGPPINCKIFTMLF